MINVCSGCHYVDEVLLKSSIISVINSDKRRRVCRGGPALCLCVHRFGSLTEHAQAVVHGHHDHVAVGGEDAGVEHVPGAFHVGAAVDKQHHGFLPAVTDI